MFFFGHEVADAGSPAVHCAYKSIQIGPGQVVKTHQVNFVGAILAGKYETIVGSGCKVCPIPLFCDLQVFRQVHFGQKEWRKNISVYCGKFISQILQIRGTHQMIAKCCLQILEIEIRVILQRLLDAALCFCCDIVLPVDFIQLHENTGCRKIGQRLLRAFFKLLVRILWNAIVVDEMAFCVVHFLSRYFELPEPASEIGKKIDFLSQVVNVADLGECDLLVAFEFDNRIRHMVGNDDFVRQNLDLHKNVIDQVKENG